MTFARLIETTPSSVSRSVKPSGESSALRRSFSAAAVIFTSTTPPPEKPIETRSASAMGGLHDLGQDAAGRLGVQEGHAGVPDPLARLLVDQLDAGLLELESVSSMSATA